MGLFNKILGNKTNGSTSASTKINWVPLESLDQLDQLTAQSKDAPVAIFKHSTRCGISQMALKSFEREFDFGENEIKMFFLDLIRYREISNEIASRFKVWHESPQLILIKDGETVHHSSHSGISAEKLREFIG